MQDMAGTTKHMGGEEAGVVVHGTVLDHFAESEEVLSLVTALPQVCEDLRSRERSEERYTSILDKYQEQPHLLDPYLEALVNQLFLLTQQDFHPIVRQQAFRYMYLIAKVRGPKVMVRWFPHEVSDFEPVLSTLQQQDPQDYETWETRYILLLWLSFLLMIPFDLSRMDGGGSNRTVDRVFDIGKLYVGVSDSCRECGAFLLAKLVTRPDVKTLKLEDYVCWAIDVMNRADKHDMSLHVLLSGVLESMCFFFKHGKRDDVVGVAPRVLSALGACAPVVQGNTRLRKLHTKVAKWLGITFMPPRVAKWRYQRGGRSLEEALAATPTDPSPQGVEEEEEEGYEVPPELEEVLGWLLTALRDRETVVRWTAARGVGKVTSRLPMELADEVLQSLLELFTSREDDGAWHGSCLALAELGRRGLLLPQRLSDVVPVVLKALTYDERRGYSSVGAHVRDAACYVCWAFARAYQPEDLQPYVTSIASGLLISMLFDREVNCRRAASAAFQENVGRHGSFPHGIHILITADYFAVGSITNSYLTVSTKVAGLPEYTKPLIDHLCDSKLLHWDSAVRELAAKALHNITPLDCTYMKDTVLPALLPLVMSSDPCLRHGALYAVAEVSHALSKLAAVEGVAFGEWIGTDTNQALLQVTPKLQGGGVFRGAVGENMRTAALKFIELMCACQLPVGVAVGGAGVLDSWQAIVDDNLSHTEETIRESAVSAFSGLCRCYYSADDAVVASVQDKLIPSYTAQLLSPSHFTRMGYSLALGGLPKSLLVGGKLGVVLDSLVRSCSDMSPSEAKFTEARRDAVHSITRICSSLVLPPVEPTSDSRGGVALDLGVADVESVFGCYMRCLGDYTMDSRGDVGAGVREAAMAGVRTLLPALAAHNGSLSPEIVSAAVCGLVQQTNEKIDRTRALACEALMTVIFHEPPLPHIPFHSNLKKLFEEAMSPGADMNWSAPHRTFPLTVELLSLPPYCYHTLLGLSLSVGGLTESTVRHSSSALLHYLGGISASVDTLNPFSSTVLKILQAHYHEARVILPLLKTLDLLLSNGVFDVYSAMDEHSFPVTLLELLNKEMKSCREPIKLLASINVYCGLLQFATIRQSTLNRIMLLLCHNFPKVRKSTADQFYVTLLTFDDLLEADVTDKVMSILSDTAWVGPIAEVREKRNSVCQMLQLPIPKVIVKSSTNQKPKAKDTLASYQDLVDRAGY